MNKVAEFKAFLQKMIDSRIGHGGPFATADDVAKVARVSKRNFTHFKIKESQEPHGGVLTKMATALGFPADYFTYAWEYFSGRVDEHPDSKYPDYAIEDITLDDNELQLLEHIYVLVEQNPDYFGYAEGDVHLEKVAHKLEELLAAESQGNFFSPL